MTQKIDTLLLNGMVVTMNANFDLIPNGAVAIDGDSIIAVGYADELLDTYTPTDIVDCTGRVIMPGLVNAHTHVPMTLLRGLNDDLRLDVWLGYLMPLEREFVTPEFCKLGTELACAEMIRSGVTTFADMYYYEEAIAEATAKAGMRALLGQTVLIFPAPDAATYEEALDRCRAFIEEWNGHPLIQPAVSPHAWYTGTLELMTACAELAIEYDVPLHTHVSETEVEVKNSQDQNNMLVVPWLEEAGILDTKLLAAHCVHIDRSEMVRLQKAGAGVAHCPTSNLKLSSGIAQVAQMLELDVNVGCATDGPASNNDLDMFEEMRLAALLGKVRRGDPTDMPARQVLEMATVRGARAVHMGDVTGSLEMGKRADICIVEMDGLHNSPKFTNNPEAVYSQLIYAAKSTDVVDVVCNGRFLMRDRQLLTVDETSVKAQAAEVAAKIDAFVLERESSPYNKLLSVAGLERQEGFEIQIKMPLSPEEADRIALLLESDTFSVNKVNRYKQYDNYFVFDGTDPHGTILRYREDEYLSADGEVYQARARLTLLGEQHWDEYPNAVILSRSRFLAPAGQSLRFYREYFEPEEEVEVHKLRRRWRITFQEMDFAINLDEVIKPVMDTQFLEIKSRTWSKRDAETKALAIGEILGVLGVAESSAITSEYVQLARG